MTRHVGRPDWDTTALTQPRIVDADASGRRGPLAAAAAACLAAPDEVSAGPDAELLGLAGVVAVRGPHGIAEVQETLDGWRLVASAVPTPDTADLAGAALVRAARLADARRLRGAQR